MRFLVPLLCLCAASSLGAVMEAESIKMGELVKPIEMPIKTDEVLKTVELPVKMAEFPLKKDEMLLKHNEMMMRELFKSHKIKPLEATDKFVEVIDNVNMANPWKNFAGKEFLFNNLLMQNFPIKPEIKAAYNLRDELEHYKKMDYPDVLPFTNDEGEVVYGIMTENAPVPIISVLDADVKRDVKFHFFNKFDEKDLFGVEVTDFNKLKELGWDENKPVKVIVHGFINSIKSPAIQMIKNAYLKTGQYNVIGVDWANLAGKTVLWYPWARDNVPVVGARVGEFLDVLATNKLMDAHKLHFIGHSLGAHVAAIAAKSMTVAKPSRITGLDPAKPLFELTGERGRLFKDDAELVDVIHTNAGYLGRKDMLGHVDFFPNGGTWQVGCTADVWGACSHGRSFELFAKTILAGRGLDGVLCDGMPSLVNGRKCLARSATNEPVIMARMGESILFKESGPYFVDYDFDKIF